MSQPVVYYWAPSLGAGYEDGIAQNQSPLVNTNLILRANRSDGAFCYIETLNINNTCNDTKSEVIRSINITSTTANSNAGVTFVINGIGCSVDANGNPTGLLGPTSENLTGPAGNSTVMSAKIYTVINSITVTVQPANNVEVGFGQNGITNYCLLDLNRIVIMGYGATYTHQFLPSPSVHLSSITYVSLNKTEVPSINGNFNSFGLINGNQVCFINSLEYQAATSTNDFGIITSPFQLIWANVISDARTTESMLFTVAQQGIY